MQQHVPPNAGTRKDDQAEASSTPVPRSDVRLWDDALVTWWERVLAGLAVLILAAMLIDILILGY
jgi:hypothetical protein